MVWCRSIFSVLLGLLLCGAAFPQAAAAQPALPPALRAAVPLLCTENNRAARTRVRGSGVIADSGVWSHFPFFYSAIIIAVRHNPVRVLTQDKPPPGA
jgi:hypothetical protein